MILCTFKGVQARFRDFTVSRHILLQKGVFQELQKGGGGVKVYIFWKLSSRPIQKSMFQDQRYGDTLNIRNQRLILHDTCDKTSTHLKLMFSFILR